MDQSILVVEDSLVIRDLITRALRSALLPFVETDDMYEALGILNKQDIALIITNLHIEEKTSLEFITRIRSFPKFNSIPALYLSQPHDPNASKDLLAAGFQGYLKHPYTREELVGKVMEMID